MTRPAREQKSSGHGCGAGPWRRPFALVRPQGGTDNARSASPAVTVGTSGTSPGLEYAVSAVINGIHLERADTSCTSRRYRREPGRRADKTIAVWLHTRADTSWEPQHTRGGLSHWPSPGSERAIRSYPPHLMRKTEFAFQRLVFFANRERAQRHQIAHRHPPAF